MQSITPSLDVDNPHGRSSRAPQRLASPSPLALNSRFRASAPTPPRPRALTPLWEGIPGELKQLPRWVVWRYEYDPQRRKWKKPPFSPSNGRADVTRPASWETYAAARQAYERGGWDGVGIVLGEGLAGLDLDDCIDERGNLSALAIGAVAELASYAELSPSGEGVRAFVLGELPDGARRRGAMELYDSGRYVTVTGARLPTAPPHVARDGGQLATLHARLFPTSSRAPNGPQRPPARALLSDADILAKATNAANGAKFRALYHGTVTGGERDASADDLALCNMLAYWTDGDGAAVERLFRQSARYRPKWDEKHYSDGATYGERTIERALSARAPYSASQSAHSAPQSGAALEALALELERTRERAERAERALAETRAALEGAEGWGMQHRIAAGWLAARAYEAGGELRIERGAVGLASRLGISEGSARAATRALSDAGVVVWEKTTRPDDKGRPRTESAIVYTPGTLSRSLPSLARDERAVRHAERERGRVERKVAEALDELKCRHCGGASHSVLCNGCGTITSAPELRIGQLYEGGEDENGAPQSCALGNSTEKTELRIGQLWERSGSVSNVPTVGGGDVPPPAPPLPPLPPEDNAEQGKAGESIATAAPEDAPPEREAPPPHCGYAGYVRRAAHARAPAPSR